MTMFSAAELADLRTTQESAMPFTCTVTTAGTEVDDDAGGTTAGTATVTTGIACRVGVPSGSDQKVAERLGIVVDAVLTLPYGTAVTSRSSIAVSTGQSYDVTYVNTEQSYATAVRALCRTVRSEAT